MEPSQALCSSKTHKSTVSGLERKNRVPAQNTDGGGGRGQFRFGSWENDIESETKEASDKGLGVKRKGKEPPGTGRIGGKRRDKEVRWRVETRGMRMMLRPEHAGPGQVESYWHGKDSGLCPSVRRRVSNGERMRADGCLSKLILATPWRMVLMGNQGRHWVLRGMAGLDVEKQWVQRKEKDTWYRRWRVMRTHF